MLTPNRDVFLLWVAVLKVGQLKCGDVRIESDVRVITLSLGRDKRER